MDAPDIEDEDYSTNKQEGGASPKRLKMDHVPKSEDNEKSVMEETDMQIKHDEEVAMELQRQLLEENDVTATGAELTEIAVEDEQSNGMNENITEKKSTEGFTSPTSVVQELEKRVDKDSKFFITIRRQTPLARILNLWRYEAKRQGGHHEIRVKFLGRMKLIQEH